MAIARDHAAYVQGLTRQRTLLERRIYVVVPWSSSVEESAPGPFILSRFWGGRRRTDADVDRQLRAETIHRVLGDRCDAISRQLSRAGLRATRLDDLGLAQLYHVGWAPEVARTQRLRRELADYTMLVVGAEPRPGRKDRSWRNNRELVREEARRLDGAGSQ